MNTKPLIAACSVAAIALSACTDHGGYRVNGGVCADFKKPAAALPGADPAVAPVDECLRRWAYTLAASRDSADVVASAAVSACASRLTAWNQTVASQQPQDNSGGGGGDQSSSGVSILTGQPTNPLAEHNVFARDRALLYVVAARAGHCAPPPIKDGAPTGA
jgi:hypothetical protein